MNPSGVQIGPLQEVLGPQRFRVGQTELLLYYGMPAPYSTRQEIFIDFLPVNDYIASGLWQIILAGNRVVDGRYDLWLPGGGVLNSGSRIYQTKCTGNLDYTGNGKSGDHHWCI